MEVELAKARKSGGSHNSEGTKPEPNPPRPDYKILTSTFLAELAASRGITKTALLAEFSASLSALGEKAEDKLGKELSEWLRKFVMAVGTNEIRLRAWEKLKCKFDVTLLLPHLYLFTYFGNTTANVVQDAFRFLKNGLDRLLPKYTKIREDTSALFNDPQLRFLSIVSEAAPQLAGIPIHDIAMAEVTLKVIRNWTEQHGSYKTNAQDFHLFAVATTIHSATHRYHYRELARLTEAASIAHGGRDEAVDEATLKRRVERYAKRRI
jgi:hypothetical protein